MKETKEIVVEGFHAVKHAVRFKISCSKIYTTDLSYARGLISDLAPDLKDEFYKHIEEIDSKSFLKYTTNPVRTKIIGLFRLSNFSIDDLDIKSRFPIIVLEDPRDLNNIGAIARTSAAFGVN
jgi:tRNA G18 (ribose-2'-O)-methylase SpoU